MIGSPNFSRRSVLSGLAAFGAAGSAVAPFALADEAVKEAVKDQAVKAAAEPAKSVIAQSRAANKLGGKLLSALTAANQERNVAIGAHSIYSALSMLTLGASGEARDKLRADGLLVGPDLESALKAQAELRAILGKSRNDKVALTDANSLWLRINGKAKPDYKSAAEKSFEAELRSVDFKSAEAVAKINKWISEKTKGAIDKVIDRIDEQTEFLLANAIHFKARWDTEFKESVTKPRSFNLRKGGTVDVPTMAGTIAGAYWKGNNWHGAVLPYHGKDFVMIVVMPKKPEPDALKFETMTLSDILDKALFAPAKLNLHLPRFKVEFGSDLKQPLKTAGYGRIFELSMRYKEITGRSIRRPDVVHKSRIDVDETGTEAAAATVVTGTRSMEEVVDFNVNRPFAFTISHMPTKLDLFCGIVENPTA